MKVLGHDDVPRHNEAMFFSNFLEDCEKQITSFIGVEPRPSFETAAGDEMQISAAVVSLQSAGHRGRLNAIREERCDA
jgi:hypothetical protein